MIRTTRFTLAVVTLLALSFGGGAAASQPSSSLTAEQAALARSSVPKTALLDVQTGAVLRLTKDS